MENNEEGVIPKLDQLLTTEEIKNSKILVK